MDWALLGGWKRLRNALHRVLRILVALVALPLLVGAAWLAKPTIVKRQRHAALPRLVYGPQPIISIKYISQAMRRLGYQADTFVYGIYHINRRQDYDYCREDFFQARLFQGKVGLVLRDLVASYLIFLWLLPRYDIFHFFFDGGFLASTPLKFYEVQLLRLAGKKVIVMPYGSDVAVPSQISSILFRQGTLMNYPQLGTNEQRTLRQIRYFTQHADFIVACMFHAETLPRWDMLTSHYYPIDTDAWQPDEAHAKTNETQELVTIVHSPNHRGLKGSEFLIAACRELQAEGYPLHLRLLERVPNSEVREILSEADILAEQFIVGYGLSAMEGMALGKPVMSNLTDPHYYQVHRLYTGLDECPIVSTAVEQIKENLRLLVTDATLRKQLGTAGRQYALKYHSYATVGRMWNLVYRKLWLGESIDLTLWHPDRFPEDALGANTGQTSQVSGSKG